MKPSSDSRAAVHGTCDRSFARVQEEFEHNFAQRGEVGACVCVMVDGEPVVDLWGGVADPASGSPWERDTVGLVFSCTKGATALCAHTLADRGLIDLDAPVAVYWPEFGRAGKEQVRVRMLLDHSAGLPALREPVPPGGFYDWDLIASMLAAQEPFWEPGTRHGYHAFTMGWLVGEVVRRISGRSLGTFFRDEIAGPLGLDFWIGAPESIEVRVAPSRWFDPSKSASLPELLAKIVTEPASIPGLAFANTGGYFRPEQCDSREAHAAEIGAAGGITNARGLAGMYAPLSVGGAGLVSEETIRRMRTTSSAGRDATLLQSTCFSLGYAKTWDNRDGDPGTSVLLGDDAFGHPGMGGSLGFADPSQRFAFGYTTNRHGPGTGLNERGQSLVDATYRCLHDWE